jgi:hypothetical protein
MRHLLKEERIDDLWGFVRMRNQSNMNLGHEERMLSHTNRIHIEMGPVEDCECSICRRYRLEKKVGHHHTRQGCKCPNCKEYRKHRRHLYYVKYKTKKMAG